MLKESTNDFKEYRHGYEDGLHDRDFNDGFSAMTALLTLGFAGQARPGAKSYAEGYKDGKHDRIKSKRQGG